MSCEQTEPLTAVWCEQTEPLTVMWCEQTKPLTAMVWEQAEPLTAMWCEQTEPLTTMWYEQTEYLTPIGCEQTKPLTAIGCELREPLTATWYEQTKPLTALGSQQRGPSFLHSNYQRPKRKKKTKQAKNTNFCNEVTLNCLTNCRQQLPVHTSGLATCTGPPDQKLNCTNKSNAEDDDTIILLKMLWTEQHMKRHVIYMSGRTHGDESYKYDMGPLKVFTYEDGRPWTNMINKLCWDKMYKTMSILIQRKRKKKIIKKKYHHHCNDFAVKATNIKTHVILVAHNLSLTT